jgi:hypothetical protein
MRSGQTRSARSSAQALSFRIKCRYVFICLPPISCPLPHVRLPDKERGKKTSDAHPFVMIQFSLIDTRPLHGMADVCEKHNIKLLTYGTFVRISLYSSRVSPSGLSSSPRSTPAPPPPISLPGSVEVFLPTHGLTGPSLIRIRAP